MLAIRCTDFRSHLGWLTVTKETQQYLIFRNEVHPLECLYYWPTLNSIRQTDVDTLMIRTQSRVRVRVRVIYLNQTGIRHQILGGLEDRVMHSRSDALSSTPTHSILNCFFLKN